MINNYLILRKGNKIKDVYYFLNNFYFNLDILSEIWELLRGK